MVCKLEKDFYRLKQAPRAWYARFDKYLHYQGFKKGITNRNVYIKVEDEIILLIVVYVDDIICSEDDAICKKLAK